VAGAANGSIVGQDATGASQAHECRAGYSGADECRAGYSRADKCRVGYSHAQHFGTLSEEEDEEDGGQQQQLVNYMFSLIFKFHFIFNYYIKFCMK
jgi:hypothetical protein